MALIAPIEVLKKDMTAWRRDLHAYPELAFNEVRTSDFVAAKLEEFGIETHRRVGGTGVVGTLVSGHGEGGAIGLRADMDALPIGEANTFEHRSRHDGVMHACGHDGHTAMLLGAARYLAETGNFRGTARFIFQPAEENEGGAKAMVEDGLFIRFPVDGVYGLHNWPGLPVGSMALGPGPIMAAVDTFEVTITGRGGHAGMPHLAIDPLKAAAEMVAGLQGLTKREKDVSRSTVLTVTRFQAGETWNVIPDQAVFGGTARSFDADLRDKIEASLREIVTGIADRYGIKAKIRYDRRYPATVNHRAETELAARAAALTVGEEGLVRDPEPSMGAEDFSYMLNERPGCYAWIGNGSGGCHLHNAHYDFNDEILTLGASYWARLVETVLPR